MLISAAAAVDSSPLYNEASAGPDRQAQLDTYNYARCGSPCALHSHLMAASGLIARG